MLIGRMHEKVPVVREEGEVHCIVATWALTWKHDGERGRQNVGGLQSPIEVLQAVGGVLHFHRMESSSYLK